jgi:hypothetical protein
MTVYKFSFTANITIQEALLRLALPTPSYISKYEQHDSRHKQRRAKQRPH